MYALLRPLLFAMDPGKAHSLALTALGPIERVGPLRALVRAAIVPHDPRLEVKTMGLAFPNPIGVAAGLDKNGERPRALAALGFGHVELGTVTAEAQGPNPPPNMFRLPADCAIVNRLGFPNAGAAALAARLRDARSQVRVPIGVSIGKSRSVALEDATKDYLTSLRAVRDVADFIVVNVSSPNTKDLRAMQAADIADALFATLVKEVSCPLLVKIAPDLDDAGIDAICDIAKNRGLAGVVATNTTIARTGLRTSAEEIERIGAGGLSGRPLFQRSLAVVKRVRARLGPEPTVIGVGGIDGWETSLAMLRNGANLLQLYTGFVYRGPLLPRKIVRRLGERLDAEHASTLKELVSQRSPAMTNGANGVHSAVHTTSS